jgi:hypothetical protein
MSGVMGKFRNETIRRLFIGLGVLAALYLGFVVLPMAKFLRIQTGYAKAICA